MDNPVESASSGEASQGTVQKPSLEPFALRDAPALIETVFPAQKVSFEAQRERKAGAGQTLTALGSYWKGRKPLILVRAILLGTLLPQTEDAEKDLEIFELLMAFDDDGLARRALANKAFSAAEVAAALPIAAPWDIFDYSIKDDALTAEEVEHWTCPLDPDDVGIRLRWRRDLAEDDKLDLYRRMLDRLPTYEARSGVCKRPEEVEQAWLYAAIWPAVNAHLGRFGIQAESHQELVEQLGILRFGHRPKVGDTFCGGGSIPFEDVLRRWLHPLRGRAARLRCLRLGPKPYRLHAHLGSAQHHRRFAREARRDRAQAASDRGHSGPGDHEASH